MNWHRFWLAISVVGSVMGFVAVLTFLMDRAARARHFWWEATILVLITLSLGLLAGSVP